MDDIKALLGRMMFSGPAVEKKVGIVEEGRAAGAICETHPLKQTPVILQIPHRPFLPQVECLSGGEKARLALAVFMLTKGTLLVSRARESEQRSCLWSSN